MSLATRFGFLVLSLVVGLLGWVCHGTVSSEGADRRTGDR